MEDTPDTFILETRKHFLLMLDEGVDLLDNAVFTSVLRTAVDACDVKVADLVESNPNINSSSLYRWIGGKPPQKLARLAMVAIIREHIESLIEEKQASPNGSP